MRFRTVPIGAYVLAGMLLAKDGIRPRGASTDYPAHLRAGSVTVAAAVIPAERVHKLFAADLNRAGYQVIEIGVFPEPGAEADVAADDFMLGNGSGSAAVRPASARTVAAVVDQKDNPPRGKQKDVDIYTTASIGYDSAGTYDPPTGRRKGAVYTSAGVGVGAPAAGGPAPYPKATRDPALLEQELWDKSLPEGKTSIAVAGYLFFPKSSGSKKNVELTWYAPGGVVRVVVPTGK